MKIACIGGGPAGLYFAISMKLRDPAHEIDGVRAQRARRHLRLGRRLLRPDGRQPARPTTRRLGADHRRRVRALGRHRRPHSAARRITSGGHGFIGIGRKRLLEHPAGPRARARRRAALRGRVRSRRSEVARLRPRHRHRRRQLALPRRLRRRVRRRHRRARATSSSGSARARCSTPSPSPSRRPSTAGSRRTPTASRPTARPSSSNAPRRPGAASASTGWTRPRAIASCEKLFAKYLDGHRLQSNAAHLRGSAAWLNFRRIKCERWSSGNVILLGDAAHTAHFSIGSGTKLALEDAIKLAEVLNRDGLSPRSRARRISGRAEPRGAQAPEQRAQLDRMVRDARALHCISSRCSSLIRCSRAASASATRTCACATANGSKASSAGSGSARPTAARTRPRRRCSRRSSCASMTLENRIIVSPMAHVFGGRRHAQRLPLRPSRRARAGRRRPGLHRDDLRLARRPDHPRLHRHVERRARRRVEAHRRLRPRQLEGEDLPPARPFRRQGLDQARLGRQRRPARRRQLAGDGGERRALVAGQPGAARR